MWQTFYNHINSPHFMWGLAFECDLLRIWIISDIIFFRSLEISLSLIHSLCALSVPPSLPPSLPPLLSPLFSLSNQLFSFKLEIASLLLNVYWNLPGGILTARFELLSDTRSSPWFYRWRSPPCLTLPPRFRSHTASMNIVTRPSIIGQSSVTPSAAAGLLNIKPLRVRWRKSGI